MSTSTVHQPLRRQAPKATYTDTDTLLRAPSAEAKSPGRYTDIDVIGRETGSARRPGTYVDVATVAGRKAAWGTPGRYTDRDS